MFSILSPICFISFMHEEKRVLSEDSRSQVFKCSFMGTMLTFSDVYNECVRLKDLKISNNL